MKIAIAGAGVAGGYLAALLVQEGLAPEIYDPMAHDTRCGHRSCGWGAPVRIATYLESIGLDLGEYVLEPMTPMRFDDLEASAPLVTIDKPRLLRDLVRDVTVRRERLAPGAAGRYDLVIDATGVERALLPPCRSELTLPPLQHRVSVEPTGTDCLGAGVFGHDVPGLGYLWVFPIGRDDYHIGVGGIALSSLETVFDRFYQSMSGRFRFTRRCACRGEVRVASPHGSMPFHIETRRKDGSTRLVVGVGESIGTVTPFTAEGIAPSLECARILGTHLEDPDAYTRAVLDQFSWMRGQRDTLDYLLARRDGAGPRLRDCWRFYRNARRSGIGIPPFEVVRQLRGLSHWADAAED